MDIFSCLTLIGHKILLLVMDELEHFTVFSSWLRSQIDRLATSSSESEELSEKEATTDIGKVLTYIEQYLASSPLHVYLDEISKEDFTADWEHIDSGVNLLDTVSAQVKKHEKGQEAMKALPHVEFLVDYATHWSSKAFEHIAETKRRSVRFGKPISLSIDQPIDIYDCRIVEADGEDAIVFVALASENSKSKLTIFRTQLDIINGISRNMPTSRCLVDLGSRTLIDFAFIDNTSLILLCKESDATTVLVSVPFRQHTIQYSPYDPANTPEASNIPTDGFPSFILPEEQQAMNPVRMEVLDSSDTHGDIPKRICLLESNLGTLRTFTLPEEGLV
uniref:Anaphase-promoting complex subunit 4 long domain-containing protein n=1 Tax=Bionectria ochroleuca TaxID=29856 RepID=A0A8H7K7X1_BIOOC